MLVCTGLVIWSLVEGFKIPNHGLFVFLEFLINLIIILDFVLRVRMITPRKYFKQVSNIFDTIVTVGCIGSFLLYVFSHPSSKLYIFETISEEALFIIWTIWQYLRILMFIKN